jgi:hypothetical protein
LVIPLYKGNNKDKSDPNSCRGITLTSVIGKLLEKVVPCKITDFCERLGSLMTYRWGSGKGMVALLQYFFSNNVFPISLKGHSNVSVRS